VLRFAQTCELIAASASKLEKVRLLAAYLVEIDDENLEAAARYFTGNPLGAADRRSLAIGWRTILEAAHVVWRIDDGELSHLYREHGDLGAALAPFTQVPQRLDLFAETLTPASLAMLLDQIADAAGKRAGRKRQVLCERILERCRDPLETKYAIKILTGEMRIGLREGLVLEGIAEAFGRDVAAVRRALMANGDVGGVALASRRGTLEAIAVRYEAPIGFMLATPLLYGSGYRDLDAGEWLTESKFDGIRAQLHKAGDRVRLFSRTLNDVSRSYPEIVEAAKRIEGSVILDGEIVAQSADRVMPFRSLQARLQRKEVSAELLAEVPVVYTCFDLLAYDDAFLIDEPLEVRRARLAVAVQPGQHLMVAPWERLQTGASTAEELVRRFEAARRLGHEGLLLKRLDSPYAPGRRGKWWLKLKKELSTLDVVVIAVEWGHGKRSKVLSDYTFAVRGDDGNLVAIGKAYSGLTDAEISELTPWFLEHRLPAHAQREKARSHEIPVEPKIVLEVAFDVIQRSDLHESGFSLRFPRIVRIRDDKPPEEIDGLDRVREIYQQMLAREVG